MLVYQRVYNKSTSKFLGLAMKDLCFFSRPFVFGEVWSIQDIHQLLGLFRFGEAGHHVTQILLADT